MKQLFFIDNNLTLFFKNLIPHNYFFDTVFSFFSLQGASIFIWILIVFFIVFVEEKEHPGISKKDKKFILAFSFALFLSFFISEILLKNIFKRLRPIPTNFNQFQLFSTNYSFPSTHSTIAFALASILAFFDKKRKNFYYILSFIIAYSRIYLGVHYFFDVLTGGIIGMIISKLLTYFSTP